MGGYSALCQIAGNKLERIHKDPSNVLGNHLMIITVGEGGGAGVISRGKVARQGLGRNENFALTSSAPKKQ